MSNQTIYELVERHQPVNMGWPEPPPTSWGLFATEVGAQAELDRIRRESWAEVLEIVPREVNP